MAKSQERRAKPGEQRWRYPAIVVALAFTLGWYTEGNWAHLMLGFTSVLFVGLPFLIFGPIVFVLKKIFPSKGWLHVMDFPYVVIVAWLGFILSCFIGLGVNEYRVYEVKAFAEDMKQPLETYYEEYGVYPETLEVFGEIHIPSRLTDYFGDYFGGGGTYGYSFDDPTAMFGGWDYSSSSGEWSYWSD